MVFKHVVSKGTRKSAVALLAFSLVLSGGFVNSTSSSASANSERFEGLPNQWGNVPNAMATSTQHLEELKAVQSGGKLFSMVKGPNLDSKGTWYIDVDGDEKTGLSIPYWEN